MGKKAPKDPNAPKKNQSSYFIFMNERRPVLAAQQKQDGKQSVTTITKVLSAEWNAMSAETKKTYQDKAAAQKARYEQEWHAYQKTDNYVKHQAVLAEWKQTEQAMGRSKGSGKNKGKAPKKPKAPDSMPKRNQSSYFLFSNEQRERIKAANPDKKLTEIAKLISAEWKTMSEDAKKVYADRSIALKADYVAKMEKYKETAEYSQYMADMEQWKKDKKAWERADEMDVDSDGDVIEKVSLPRKPKDEKCPKRPLTSYFLYAKDVRAAVKAEFPDKAITEIAKEISKKWKLLTEEEKKPFNDESATLKEQYKKDLAEYEGSEAQQEYKAKLQEWKEECDRRKNKAREKAAAKKAKKAKNSPRGKSKKRQRKMQESSDESSSGSDSDSDSSSGSSSDSSSGSESDSDSSSGSESSSE